MNFAAAFGPTGGPRSLVTGFGFFDDFIGTSVGAVNVCTWNTTASTNGTVVASDTDANGAMLINSGTGSSDDAHMALNGLPFRFDYTKDLYFEAEIDVDSIATNTGAIFAGIGVPETDLADGVITVNHCGFTVDASADPALLRATTGDGSNQTTNSTGKSMVADTKVLLQWRWHARAQKITFHVDGAKVDVQSVEDADTLPDDQAQLTLHFIAEKTLANGVDLTVHHVLVTGDR